MISPLRHASGILVVAIALVWVPACRQVAPVLPPSGPQAVTEAQLKVAVQAIRRADRTHIPQEKASHALLAAEIAWDLDWKTSGPVLKHDNRKAAAVYDAAVVELLELMGDPKTFLREKRSEILIDGPRGPYRLLVDQSVYHTLRDYPLLKPAFEYKGEQGFRRRITRDGIGLPVVAINRDAGLAGLKGQGTKDAFKRREGYTSPRTVVLVFGKPPAPGQPREVRVRVVDPRKEPVEPVGKRVLPIASDLTAPLMAAYPQFGSVLSAVRSAINPEVLWPKSGIYAIELYDPERIPVLLVHGLFSTPDMWKNLINELNASPGVGNRYQFYAFTYPTGVAPHYTASILRKKLTLAHQETPLPDGYILIGHSMGGILSRMQITDSGKVLWDHQFGRKSAQALRRLPEDDPVYQSLVFKHDPLVRRAIFVCVPHRGSPVAEKSLVRWFARFAKVPITLTQEVAASPLRFFGMMPDRVASSADGLSPESPVLTGLATLPMTAPAHSIIGNQGKAGPLEESSDGIVPYRSSHLEKAESEKIIPAGHGGFDHAESIREIERILLEDSRHTRTKRPLNSTKIPALPRVSAP